MKQAVMEPAAPASSAIGSPGAATLSDETIVARILGGERDLFGILMRRYNQRLYRVAYSVLRNEAEAEDVVQDAYVRAFAHLGQYSGAAKFSTWLTRIAVHEGLRRRRKQGHHDAFQRSASATPSVLRGTDRRASDREIHRSIEAAIEDLPPAYRSVVMLRDVEDLSTAEAAECLGIPPATVKTRLHRAHALLRVALASTVGTTWSVLFAFGSSRCDRLVRVVLQRIAARPDRES